MIFEDAQWSDPTSLELLGRMVDRIRTLRVLLIVTFRPEFDPPWIGPSHVTALILNRLSQREVGVMVEHVAGDKLLPASAQRDIIERSDGVPLFVEEMTKAVLEAEGGTGTGALTTANVSLAAAVPATLHASLMARLDRLGPSKAVAQIGATIGREFSHALLAAVAQKSEADLGAALDGLVQSGLLFRWGAPPHATYQFKHALVRDAAYGALLRDRKRALHTKIVEVLESEFTDTAERQPALLARHCTEAGLSEKAARLWGKAGQRSLERSALVEATEQLTRALDQISSLPSTPMLRREQVTLQFALANALKHVKGFAAPETKAAEERARLLAEQARDPGEHSALSSFVNLANLFSANMVAFNGQVCRDLAAQILALAEKQGASGQLIIARYMVGISLACTGELAQGRASLDRALELYDPVEQRPQARRTGLDFRVQILSYRSIVLWMLGYPHDAIADAAFAVKDAREIGHAASLMFALNVASLTHACCRNYATANTMLDELLALATEKRALYWQAGGRATRGFVFALTGKGPEAVREMTEGWAAYRSTGGTWLTPTCLSHLAMAYADVGEFDRAAECIDEAVAAARTTQERWYQAEIHRIAGEIALGSPERDAPKAQACFECALEVARAQQARSWELRAAMSLARLWRSQGRRAEAQGLLAPIYGWFTQGFDTLDIKEAKALLDELGKGEPRAIREVR
jgi:predicted ATPase